MGEKGINSITPSTNEHFAEVVEMILRAKRSIIQTSNTTLIDLYWQIGAYISEKLAHAVWGEGVVKQLADYISKKFPGQKGFSDKNLWRMKQFYESYQDCDVKLSALLRQISWTNNLTILSRSKSDEERKFYIIKCIQERWSSRELDRQIDSALFERSMVDKPKLSSVMRQLNPNAELHFRDQYVLEFLGEHDFNQESTLRKTLVKRIKLFILELGKDFLFIDDEYRLQVGNSDFRIDLLFFHRELQCLVAFELKMGKFKPEHLGQLNFYLEALDRDVKKPKENPSIGVLLCKDKDNEVVEYALSRSLSPTMVAEYKISLPDKKLLRQKMQELCEDFPDDES